MFEKQCNIQIVDHIKNLFFLLGTISGLNFIKLYFSRSINVSKIQMNQNAKNQNQISFINSILKPQTPFNTIK